MEGYAMKRKGWLTFFAILFQNVMYAQLANSNLLDPIGLVVLALSMSEYVLILEYNKWW